MFSKKSSKNSQKKPQIGLVLFSKDPFTADVHRGFASEISKGFNYGLKLAVGDGDVESIRAVVKRLLRNYSCDLIYTVGKLCTEITADLLREEGQNIPIVFAGIRIFPDTFERRERPPSFSNATGLLAPVRDYSSQIDVFLTFKPKTRRALIPYNPTLNAIDAFLATEAANHFRRSGVDAEAIAINNARHVAEELMPYLDSVDTIFLIRDTTLMLGLDQLIQLCNSRGIALFSSDLTSVKVGAAVGLGDLDETIGRQLARKGLPILTEGASTSDIAPTNLDYKLRLMVNRAAAERQGIDVSLDALLERDDIPLVV